MKILAIRFMNLNSLVGEWSIDLRHPDYEAQGLFAIIGPTGAGKTTILDAVCLALYGRTPRLPNVKKSGNEIMSRQTGECFAEVLFATGEGEFRCHWSQRRARKKPSGELQDQRHELTCGDKVLESSIKGVARKVEELTGMDFARFTRAVLLAQGDFAAFLQGSADERSSILEKITGTEIYSRISARVHERCSRARQELEALRESVEGLRLVAPGQEEICRRELAEVLRAEADLQRMAGEVQENIRWREALRDCRDEVRLKEDELHNLERERVALKPQALLLERDAAARQCLEHLHDAERCREELRQQEAACAAERLTLAALGEKLQEWQRGMAAARAAAARVHAEAAQRLPVLQDARQKDVLIAAQTQRVREAQEHLASAQAQSAERQEALQALAAQQEALARRREENDAALLAAAADAALPQELPRLRQACADAEERRTRWLESRALAETAAQNAERAEQQRNRSGQQREAAVRRQEQERQRHTALEQELKVILEGRSAEDWQEEERHLAELLRLLENWGSLQEELAATAARQEAHALRRQELAVRREELCASLERETERLAAAQREEELLRELYLHQQAVSTYEQARQHLHDGAPCPLCGALEHPYAAGVKAEPDNARQRMTAQGKIVAQHREKVVAMQTELARIDEQAQQAAAGILETRRQESLLRERAEFMRAEAAASLPALANACSVQIIAEEAARCRQRQDVCRQVILEIRRRKERMLDAEAALRRADEDVAQAVLAEKSAEVCVQSARNDAQRRCREQADARAALEKAREACVAALSPYGVQPDFIPELLAGQVQELEHRARHRLAIVQQGERLQQESLLLAQKKEHLDELCAHAAAACLQHAAAFEEAEKRLAEQREERRALGVGPDPAAEEEALHEAAAQAERHLEETVRQHADTEQRRLVINNSLEERLRAVEACRRASHTAEDALQASLHKRNFTREEDARKALLTEEERGSWQDRLDSLHMRQGAAQIGLEQASHRLHGMLCDNRTPLDLPALHIQAEGVQEALRLAQQRLGACRQTLEAAEQQREQQARTLAEMASREQVFQRWQALDALIGAAEGKTYRKFVQGLTFERLLAHANRRLRELSDRYVLLADQTRHLEFQVMDNYQAGECRSARNLSGGESFLVSLALALGLSRMTGHSIKIESLFLDEGFGTLDEDALDAALSVLSQLRQEGTLIGIISHVPALRERISAQIAVIPEAGGLSRLEGAGCSRVE